MCCLGGEVGYGVGRRCRVCVMKEGGGMCWKGGGSIIREVGGMCWVGGRWDGDMSLYGQWSGVAVF